MRPAMCIVILLATGCTQYTESDNATMVDLFSSTLVSAVNSAQHRRVPATEWQFNQTVPCPAGGSMGISASVTVNIDPQSLNGYAAVHIMMTLTDCAVDADDGTRFTVQGANYLTLTGHDTAYGGNWGPWSFQFAGGYDVYANGDMLQHCSVQATLSETSGWSGQWCGYALR